MENVVRAGTLEWDALKILREVWHTYVKNQKKGDRF
jgi:hypothetical protein